MVDWPAEAAAFVLASHSRFAGITPLLQDVIGQSAWYEAYPSDSTLHDSFEVDVTIGWGDCLAGCRFHHTWHHWVDSDGAVGGPREFGDDLPPVAPRDAKASSSLDITIVTPICPVGTGPPHPGCTPRAVPNATVVIRDLRGNEVARPASDIAGHARAHGLPAGIYLVQPMPVGGYADVPPTAAVWARGRHRGTATLVYETGR